MIVSTDLNNRIIETVSRLKVALETHHEDDRQGDFHSTPRCETCRTIQEAASLLGLLHSLKKGDPCEL